MTFGPSSVGHSALRRPAAWDYAMVGARDMVPLQVLPEVEACQDSDDHLADAEQPGDCSDHYTEG